MKYLFLLQNMYTCKNKNTVKEKETFHLRELKAVCVLMETYFAFKPMYIFSTPQPGFVMAILYKINFYTYRHHKVRLFLQLKEMHQVTWSKILPGSLVICYFQ